MSHLLGLEERFKRAPLLAQKYVETVNQNIENDRETKLRMILLAKPLTSTVIYHTT